MNKRNCQKMEERINEWKKGQMNDKWREYEWYFTTFWIQKKNIVRWDIKTTKTTYDTCTTL